MTGSASGLQTNTRRLELYIRVSLYVILACLPLGILSAASEGQPPVVLLAMPALAVGSIFACRWSLAAMYPPVVVDPRHRLALIGYLALSVAVIGWLLVTAPATPAWGGALFAALGCPLAAFVVLVRPVLVALACVGSGVVLAAVAHLRIGWDLANAAALAAALTLLMAFLLYTFWLSGWMLRVVRELDDARRQAAELAIAEERLRISRDLHDLFGRTLAAVAVKSELAAQLVRRGQPDSAATEIEAVRQLADASGKEVRQVVHGYREAGLDVELAGARALLDSAGIRCAVRGDPPSGLDPAIAAVLGWVLRESVTNVIRHSRARECLITLTVGTEIRLAVTNDGVSGSGASDGRGLIGMAERLHAVGGELEHDRSGDRFTVNATAPARRDAVTEARR